MYFGTNEPVEYLWLLSPRYRGKGSPWYPWYDCTFNQVVIAPDEQTARAAADLGAGEEYYNNDNNHVWTDRDLVCCREIGICTVPTPSDIPPGDRVIVIDRRLA
jgi:hypothetical protein